MITNPKYFDIEEMYRRKRDDLEIELIIIFNSKRLYNRLSKEYKCVNLNRVGVIESENFFPKPTKLDKRVLEKFLKMKQQGLSYFRKLLRKALYRTQDGIIYYNWDTMHHHYLLIARKKKNYNDKYQALENGIFLSLFDTLGIYKGVKFANERRKFLEIIFNYANSFYRSYIYSFYNLRGAEVLGDFFRYAFLINVHTKYLFDSRDIYKDTFRYEYLRVLSRLFIESVSSNDIKKFVAINMEIIEKED